MNTENELAFATLKKTSFTADGAYAFVTLSVCDGSSECFKLTYDSYAENVRGRTEFSPEDMELLSCEHAYCGALLSALGSLSYGSNTQMELYRKLIKKHFSKEAALRAVKYIKKSGFIDERSIVTEEVRSCVGKLWGPSRIRSRLIARGFGKNALALGMKLMDETDFDDLCVECAKKRIRIIPETFEERQKAIAALARLGYSYDSAKRAVELLSDGEDFF